MHYVGEKNEFEINTNKQIGSGSFGAVYECQNKSNTSSFQFQLCAKVTQIFSDSLANQEEQKKDMSREKHITEIVSKNKDNENLVQVYYVKHDQVASKLIVIMEKCVSNLDTEWKKKNVYQEHEIVDFLCQFLNGYRALYESNVIHRDLKPENILIQQIGDQKFYRLADFGIGRIYKLNDFKFTKKGTPIYASPELNSLIQDSELDRQFGLMKKNKQKSIVDIYSLGIILHQLMMGGYPCQTTAAGIKQFMNKIKSEKFKLNAKINTKLANLIEKMIVYNPNDRMTFETLYEECNRLTMIRISVQKPMFFKPAEQQNSSQQFPQQDGQQFNQPNFQPNINPNFQPKIQTNSPISQNLFQTLNPGQNVFPILPPITFIHQFTIKDEICNYLKKILKIHKNTLSPQSIKTFEDFILERAPLSEIGKLYDNFDKTINYNSEEMQFYYCLKYGVQGLLQVNKKSYEDQKRDLSN